MVRVQIHLTEWQLGEARRISANTGLPVAELVRRALDKYLVNVKMDAGGELIDEAGTEAKPRSQRQKV